MSKLADMFELNAILQRAVRALERIADALEVANVDRAVQISLDKLPEEKERR